MQCWKKQSDICLLWPNSTWVLLPGAPRCIPASAVPCAAGANPVAAVQAEAERRHPVQSRIVSQQSRVSKMNKNINPQPLISLPTQTFSSVYIMLYLRQNQLPFRLLLPSIAHAPWCLIDSAGLSAASFFPVSFFFFGKFYLFFFTCQGVKDQYCILNALHVQQNATYKCIINVL